MRRRKSSQSVDAMLQPAKVSSFFQEADGGIVGDHLADRRGVNADSLRYLLQRVAVFAVGKRDYAISLLLPPRSPGREKLVKRGTADMPQFSWDLGDILTPAEGGRMSEERGSEQKNGGQIFIVNKLPSNPFIIALKLGLCATRSRNLFRSWLTAVYETPKSAPISGPFSPPCRYNNSIAIRRRSPFSIFNALRLFPVSCAINSRIVSCC